MKTKSATIPNYFLHAVNPHAGAEFADLYFDGRKFGITQCRERPISQIQFLWFFETREAADKALRDNPGKLTDMTKKFPPSAESVLGKRR